MWKAIKFTILHFWESGVFSVIPRVFKSVTRRLVVVCAGAFKIDWKRFTLVEFPFKISDWIEGILKLFLTHFSKVIRTFWTYLFTDLMILESRQKRGLRKAVLCFCDFGTPRLKANFMDQSNICENLLVNHWTDHLKGLFIVLKKIER